MTFVAPVAFALAALTVPIVVLYMLKSRRSRTIVSSTLLWEQGPQTVSASKPWQRLRPSWPLILQLLALMILVLAIARPARPTSAPVAEHTIIVIDTSASMQASVPGGRTRLDEAKRAALKTVESLGPGRRMSLIDAGPQARVVLSGSTEPRALVQGISALRTSDGTTDAAGAFALGASLEVPDVPTIIHFYSDGGVRPEDRSDVPPTVVHIPVGAPAGNVGIARVSASARSGGWDVYVRVVNTGTVRADAAVVLSADGRKLVRQAVRLEPQSGRDLRLSIPAISAAGVEARLEGIRPAPGALGRVSEQSMNALAVDDAARATLDRGAGTKILLATPGNVFLESLLKSVPGATVTKTDRTATARGHTVAVYDRIAPPPALEAPSLVIAAPGGAPGVTVAGTITKPVVTFSAPREPLLEQADLSRLAIRAAQRIAAPQMRTLLAAGDDAMLAVGVPGGRRLAYLSFDLRDSNLPVQVAFPVVFGNLMSWLSQGESGDRAALQAGDALPLRVPGRADRFRVRFPSGQTVTRPAVPASFDETDRAGFYRVDYFAGTSALGQETFAVNVPSLESNLAPRPVTAPLATRGQGSGRLGGLRVWGPGILAIVLAVLAIEWWVSHGRPTRRRRFPRTLPVRGRP